MTTKPIDKKVHAFTHACTLLPGDAHWHDPITPDMALHIEAEAVRQYAAGVAKPGHYGDETSATHFVQPAERPNGAPDGYAYRYPCADGGTVIMYNRGGEVNGTKPLEAIPFYFGAAPTQSTQQPDAGTFACPICGKAEPHQHSGDEIVAHRNKTAQQPAENQSGSPIEAMIVLRAQLSRVHIAWRDPRRKASVGAMIEEMLKMPEWYSAAPRQSAQQPDETMLKLSELLRGLECKPGMGAASPGQMYALGAGFASIIKDLNAKVAQQPAERPNGAPDVLFDGYAVLQALDDKAKARTGPENVSDVLDALVRIIKAAPTQSTQQPDAGEPMRPTDDELWDQTLRERDQYHEIADDLAAQIAAITGEEIGEHSSANDPWRNAMLAADEFIADQIRKLCTVPAPQVAQTALALQKIMARLANLLDEDQFSEIEGMVTAAGVKPPDDAAFKNFHRALCERFGYVHDEIDWLRDQVSLIEHIAKQVAQTAEGEPMAWMPIDSAPKDNKRPLYLARFDETGSLLEIDFDGTWEYWRESWELAHINGYCWMSANGIEEPTHWAYQLASPPHSPIADSGVDEDGLPVGFAKAYNRVFARCEVDNMRMAACEDLWRAALAVQPKDSGVGE